ncbi:MAG: SUF system Fe-S cluster assembly regulator [Planctomycetes bacterium]|nr:SUF system Fe-S cluster assembly regulator [Planctomycetota bacterium]
MMRITKITDHGIVLLARFARAPLGTVLNARDLAGREQLSLPMVSKILKVLLGSGLLHSHRGVKGGYSLARAPEGISLAEIVGALEGPVALTDCTDDSTAACHRETFCRVRPHWKLINRIILRSMEDLTLKDLAAPPAGPDAVAGKDSGNHGKDRTKRAKRCPRSTGARAGASAAGPAVDRAPPA